MSASRYIEIRCDVRACTALLRLHGASITLSEARRTAHNSHRWSVHRHGSRTQDYCPAHTQFPPQTEIKESTI